MSAHNLHYNLGRANASAQNRISDPGAGGTITDGGKSLVHVILTSAGTEVRTLADPSSQGNKMTISGGDLSAGAVTITADSPVDETGNSTLVYSDYGDIASLEGVYDASGTLAWRVLASDGVGGVTIALSDISATTLTVTGASVFSTVDVNGTADAIILDADADTSISAPTDDQIDFEIAGADDFTMTANTFTALSGSTIATNTIAETTSGSGVTIDGLLLKDGEVGPLADGDSVIFGAGSDVSVNWNGTYLESNSALNPMWDNCPSKLDPNYLAVAYDVEDDFYEYDTTATAGRWVLTSVGTGTPALADEVAGGVVVLTCQATTDDATHQIKGVSAPFKLAAGKTLWFETRFKLVGDATNSELSIGLVALGEDLSAVADALPADGVVFVKQDTGTGIALTCSKDGTDTGAVAGVHTLVNNTYVTLGLLIDGVTSVTPYVNGVAGTAATATICDDESLTPSFLVRNGDATTQEVLHVDYVRCVQLR